jgi:CRISPR-associated protein Csh2
MTNEKQDEIIEKRRELVFLYSVKDANPNGDPDDENRPRTDINGYNIVSDVRLKRTIRDYLIEKDNSILVKREFNNEGEIQNMEDLITGKIGDKPSREDILKEIPEEFLDVRLFGLTAAVPDANCSITGPIQFSIGKSLNIPNINTHSITSVMSAGERKGGGAIGTFHVVDYSLIAFEGVICPNLAKYSKLSKADLKKFYKALWWGTKTLNTRTKFNHLPQLLISVKSKNREFLIGDLAYQLKIEGEAPNLTLILDDFITRIKKFINKTEENPIESIDYYQDPDLNLSINGKEGNDLEKLWPEDLGIQLNEINLD